MRKIHYLITGIGILLLPACLQKKEKITDTDNPVMVSVSITGDSAVMHTTNASGKLVAKNSVNISTRMMGYITGIRTEVGQAVHAGQLLVSINSNDIQAKGGQASAQIAQAQANFNIAKKDYDRFTKLFELQSASQKELDDMRARYEMAKAALDAARMMKNEVNAQYSYTNIVAPISGIVTAKYVKPGDMANPGMPLLTIEAPSHLQAQAMVSEEQIPFIHTGQQVNITIKSSNKQLTGTVSEVSLSSANTGGQYLVKIDISEAKGLLPGMYVNVQFPFEIPASPTINENKAMTVPVSAIVEQGQLKGIYTISSQKTALLRWLRLGKQTGDKVEVLSGLSSGEQYITYSDGKLFNGVKVKIK